MAPQYTEDKTIETLKKELEKIESLYNSRVINRKSITKKDGNNKSQKRYSEVCSKYLLDNYNTIFGEDSKNIGKVNRKKGYFVNTHDAGIKKITNRFEEILAKTFHLIDIPKLGMVFDYQIPLKGRATDEGVGKIDMVAIDEGGTISLIELKAADSTDTLLRCALEIYTYSKQFDTTIFSRKINENETDKDIDKYINKYINSNEELVNRLKKFNNNFKSIVLIFEGSIPAEMVNNNEYFITNKLIEKLGVKVYVYPQDVEFKAFANIKELPCIKKLTKPQSLSFQRWSPSIYP